MVVSCSLTQHVKHGSAIKRKLTRVDRTGKKGISGVERTIRMTAHMLHTQFLLYHGILPVSIGALLYANMDFRVQTEFMAL